MGLYLNPTNDLFVEAVSSEIYVDKTGLIRYTNRVLRTQQKYICVSRPRRFGKSMTAQMLSAYYSRGTDSERIFERLSIGAEESFRKYLNKFDVISINIQEFLSRTNSMDGLIARLKKRLLHELLACYPGDYFDQRYQYIEAEKDADSIFGLYAPTEKNNVFYDGLVIPTTCENIDLAHKFIDFFLDTDNSFDNTDFVGYAPVIEAVHQKYVELSLDTTGDDYEYYSALMAIEAFDPSKITNGEVYKYISADYDDVLEGYYTEIRGN
jgi:hypothetical protein